MYLKSGSGQTCLMNKHIAEKTLNDQTFRGMEKFVYLKFGSGRKCSMNKYIVEETLNEQKYRMLEKFVYLKLGSGPGCASLASDQLLGQTDIDSENGSPSDRRTA